MKTSIALTSALQRKIQYNTTTTHPPTHTHIQIRWASTKRFSVTQSAKTLDIARGAVDVLLDVREKVLAGQGSGSKVLSEIIYNRYTKRSQRKSKFGGDIIELCDIAALDTNNLQYKTVGSIENVDRIHCT